MADKEKTAKTGQEKRVVFFENNSWYHRTKELMDDMTVKYSKKEVFRRQKKQKEAIGNMKTVSGTGSGNFKLPI